MTHQDVQDFADWCLKLIQKHDGNLSFTPRLVSMYPEYNTYIILDDTCKNILPEGVFITLKQVYHYYKGMKKLKPTDKQYEFKHKALIKRVINLNKNNNDNT